MLSLINLTISPALLFELLAVGVAYFLFRTLIKLYLLPSPFAGVPGPKAQSWAMGNLGQLFNAKGIPFHKSLPDLYGGIVKVYGFFGDEQLYITDPRTLHSILIKDSEAFDETSVFTETNRVIFGPGLVSTTGAHHKRQRQIVNPVFSVTQLKELTPVFYDVAEKLADVLTTVTQTQQEIDLLEWLCRVALEVVGRTILGYSFDPLDSPHNNPYTSAIKELIPTLFRLSLIRQFMPFLTKLGPPQLRRAVVDLVPNSTVQAVKNMSDVMYSTANDILTSKEAETTSQERSRDIISVLLSANRKARSEEKMDRNELIGQMTVLIFGAQDTTSSALSQILYMLSMHQEAQDRLRAEIEEAQSQEGSRLSYDTIVKLPYLDAVLKETLRLLPPVPFVRRTTLDDRVVPVTPSPHLPADMTALTIPKGTTLFVNIAGANRLESVFGPDAKEWRPERWLQDKPAFGPTKLPGIYAGMLSFLGGERSCIGYKFAQVEMKILLVTLLSRFKFQSTKHEVIWNLSQIISPSMKMGGLETKGLPLHVTNISA